MKAKVLIWNNKKKTVERLKLDLNLTCEIFSIDKYKEYRFFLKGKCPFDNKKTIFFLVAEKKLSQTLEKEIEKIIKDTKHYARIEIKDFKEKIDTIIDYYRDFPEMDEEASLCIHFAPRRYYSEEKLIDMGIDIRDIDAVESGVAIVNINDVIRELVNEMKELKRLRSKKQSRRNYENIRRAMFEL